MKILIVDDNEESLYLLESLLKGSGYEVVSAAEGAAALERLHDEGADMIIADILMPVMDGFQLCRNVRQDESLKDIPFIFYTATYTDEKDEEFALKLGADRYIRKPVEPEEFMQIIQDVIKDVQSGNVAPKKLPMEEKDAFKLYSERLVNKLERKMLALKEEIAERKQAEEELARLLKAMQTTKEAINITNPDTVMIYTNDAMDELFGYEKGELIGKDVSILNVGTPQESRKVPKEVTDAIRKNGVWEQEMRSKRKDGTEFISSAKVTALTDKDGQVVNYVCAQHDITERKRAEEEAIRQAAVLQAINDVFREALTCQTEEELGKACLAVAEKLTGSKFGFICEVNRSGRLDTIAISDPGWDACRIPGSREIVMQNDLRVQGIRGKVIQDGVAMIFNEPVSHLDWIAPPEGHPTITSFLGVPLKHQGKTIGMIGLGNKEGGYAPADQEAAEGLAVAVVEALRTKRAEEALRESEEKYRRLFATESDAIMIFDAETRQFADVNDAAVDLYGYTREEFLNMKQDAVTAEPEQSRITIKQAAEGKLSRIPIRYHKKKDGTVFPVEIATSTFTWGGRRMLCGVIRDITERKQAEEEIANLAKFPAEDPDPVLRAAGDGTVIFANKAALPLLDAWSCQVDQALPKQWAELVASVVVSGAREDVEIKCDGQTFLVTFAPVVEAGYVNLYAHDITERKRAEESLRLSHVCLEIANKERDPALLLREFVAKVQAFTRCAAVGIRLLDERGNIPYEAYTGFSERFYESESSLSIKSDKCMCINVIKGDTDPGLPFYSEGGSFYMNATTRFLATVSQEDKGQTRNVCNEFGYESVALVPIASEGRIVGLIHVADPKENMVPLQAVKVLEKTALQLSTAVQRVAAEQDVRRSHKELRALAARLQAAREEERILLARKFHDDVGHNLAALKRELAWLGGKLPKAAGASRTPDLGERLESMSKLLAETIQTARETASDLRPGLLDDVGLAAAIEWEAKQFQRRTEVKCTFTDTAEQTQLDDEQSTALFRICQELLANIANHAGATAVTIALKKQADELILEVSDNGKGIRDKQISSSRSLGILGMRERTIVLGGAFSITGKPGKGTTATVQIPLDAPAQARGK